MAFEMPTRPSAAATFFKLCIPSVIRFCQNFLFYFFYFFLIFFSAAKVSG